MDNHRNNKYKAVISTQYFVYFGVLGVYLPFFNLYCYDLGFNGIQIGIISSLRSIVLVIFSVLWSFIADRFQKRKSIYVVCNWLSTLIWGLYFFSDSYWTLLFITGLYGLFYAPIIAFLEAFTIDILGKQKREYGSIRAWGSISFITMVVVLGYAIDLFSIRIILWVIFLNSMFQSALSMKMPSIALTRNDNFFSRAKSFLRRRVVVFLFCAFLMLVSHGMYYGFFSIHLVSLGYGSLFVGFAWALASVAEVAVMIKSKFLFKHTSYEKMLIISFVVAAVRWILVGYVHSPFAILSLQLLHAVTYGMFHMASILYIDLLSPHETKTMGQAINNATTYGLGLMVGFFLSGVLYEHFNAAAGFFTSGVVALFSCIIFIGYRVLNSRSRPVN
jgi:PPP family 3-phenylpropionic acid transporter